MVKERFLDIGVRVLVVLAIYLALASGWLVIA
jgi:hypothetical protein